MQFLTPTVLSIAAIVVGLAVEILGWRFSQ